MTAPRARAGLAALVAAVLVQTWTAAGLVSGATQPRTLVRHDFSTSAEDWTIATDTGVAPPDFHADGGHPGGYISREDEPVGEVWYFRAPPGVLAQLPKAEHGTIRYSLKQSPGNALFPDDDIVIIGRAGRLSYRFNRAPGTEWTSFEVELSEMAGWRWNWNQEATQAHIRSVLENPVRLEIRGEYQTGPDTGAFDSFILVGSTDGSPR